MRELTYKEAAVEAVAEEMRRDPKIFYMSTDALPPLLREFGDVASAYVWPEHADEAAMAACRAKINALTKRSQRMRRGLKVVQSPSRSLLILRPFTTLFRSFKFG